MATMSATVHARRTPRLVWVAAALEAALALASTDGRSGYGFLWLVVGLALMYRIGRRGSTAWTVLVLFDVICLGLYLSYLGPLEANQPTWWYVVAPALLLAQLGVLLSTPVRRWVS